MAHLSCSLKHQKSQLGGRGQGSMGSARTCLATLQARPGCQGCIYPWRNFPLISYRWPGDQAPIVSLCNLLRKQGQLSGAGEREEDGKMRLRLGRWAGLGPSRALCMTFILNGRGVAGSL